MGSVWAAGLCEFAKAGFASRSGRRRRLRVLTLRFIVLLRSLGSWIVSDESNDYSSMECKRARRHTPGAKAPLYRT